MPRKTCALTKKVGEVLAAIFQDMWTLDSGSSVFLWKIWFRIVENLIL